jgi:hypothetical protein
MDSLKARVLMMGKVRAEGERAVLAFVEEHIGRIEERLLAT